MKYLKYVLLICLFVPVVAAAPFWMQCLIGTLVALAIVMPGRNIPWYMNLGGVNVTLGNGNLGGSIQTSDGVCGLILTGVTEGGGYTLGTPVLVNSMADVATAGITLANNPFAIQKLQDFYNELGTSGALWVMLVANTVTVAAMTDNTNANTANKLRIASGGTIRILGVCADDVAVHTGGGTITITNGLNADVYTAAANAKVLAAAWYALVQPVRVVIGGSSYSGTASALTAENTGTSNNRVAIVVGDSQNWDATYSSACVGLVLGRLAAVPVQRKISRRKDGAVSAQAAYLKTTAIVAGASDPGTIAGKGFISLFTPPTKSGFYFTGDPTLTVSTDDYCMLARGRVIDKAYLIAYDVFDNEVDDEVPAVAGTGLIDPGFAASLQTKIEDAINENMTSLGNCDGVTAFIDPSQNVVSTNTVNVALTIDAVGYASTINILLGMGL